jgi:hypothetical protein
MHGVGSVDRRRSSTSLWFLVFLGFCSVLPAFAFRAASATRTNLMQGSSKPVGFSAFEETKATTLAIDGVETDYCSVLMATATVGKNK